MKCKECRNTYFKENYRLKHPKKPKKPKADRTAYHKEYYLNNKLSINTKNKQYYYNNKEKVIKKCNEYKKNKLKNNVSFRLRNRISKSISSALKINNCNKGGKSFLKYLNYTIEELKSHLESLFESWMNWNNWGSYKVSTWDDNDPSTWTWNIDHIQSQSKLPYASMFDENFKKCWALENLRPYSAKQNIIDGSREI
jgi:hypothetical protein